MAKTPTCIICGSRLNNNNKCTNCEQKKTMQTKVFSVKDGTLIVNSGNLFLCEDRQDEVPIATTFEADTNGSVYIIPSTLIRKQKTNEELAEEKYPVSDNWKTETKAIVSHYRQGFIAGLKARGGEFHLTREQLEQFARNAHYSMPFNDNISSLTPPIYPQTITVEHDGEKYYWETLKAEY